MPSQLLASLKAVLGSWSAWWESQGSEQRIGRAEILDLEGTISRTWLRSAIGDLENFFSDCSVISLCFEFLTVLMVDAV